jgi:hypothetical protein
MVHLEALPVAHNDISPNNRMISKCRIGKDMERSIIWSRPCAVQALAAGTEEN